MAILSENEAQYFCNGFDTSKGSTSESIDDYFKRITRSSIILNEGTPAFNEMRSNLLRNTERDLFLAASNLYSTHRLLASGFASWSHVTSYYCNFYSVRALLSMFGVYISAPFIYVDVISGTAGMQKIVVRTKRVAKTEYETLAPGRHGPHQIFWEVYYQLVRALHSYVTDPSLSLAIVPNGSNPTWQIENRNEINYDALKSVELIKDFDINFNIHAFPASLPGVLHTQFILSRASVALAFKYAKQFRLNTDALNCLPGRRTLSNKLKRFIIKAGRGVAVDANTRRILI